MLTRLRRWLGWDADTETFTLGAAEALPPRGSKRGAPTRPPAQAKPRPAAKPAAAARPQLSLGKPAADDGFDPYNTGAFNRSQSWEKISRSGR